MWDYGDGFWCVDEWCGEFCGSGKVGFVVVFGFVLDFDWCEMVFGVGGCCGWCVVGECGVGGEYVVEGGEFVEF